MFAPSAAPTPDEQPRGVVTAAERTAPTMLSQAEITDGGAGVPVSPPLMSSQVPTTPTLVVSEQELARRAAARSAEFPSGLSQAGSIASAPAPAAQAQKRSAVPFIAVGVIALLIVLGAGGFAVFHFLGSSAKTSSSGSAKDTTKPDAAMAAHEIGRYWVEVDTPDKENV